MICLPRLARGFSLFSAHQNLGSDIQSNVSPTKGKHRDSGAFSFVDGSKKINFPIVIKTEIDSHGYADSISEKVKK